MYVDDYTDFKPFVCEPYIVVKAEWLCAKNGVVVGIIKVKLPKGKYKYIIGLCDGEDWREDVQEIIRTGKQYDNLDFLKEM